MMGIESKKWFRYVDSEWVESDSATYVPPETRRVYPPMDDPQSVIDQATLLYTTFYEQLTMSYSQYEREGQRLLRYDVYGYPWGYSVKLGQWFRHSAHDTRHVWEPVDISELP
jgi:hypothetical protein